MGIAGARIPLAPMPAPMLAVVTVGVLLLRAGAGMLAPAVVPKAGRLPAWSTARIETVKVPNPTSPAQTVMRDGICSTQARPSEQTIEIS